MNKIILIGNITGDPDVRATKNGTSVCMFNIAVQRERKNQDGEKVADFFQILCWRGLADIVGKYCHKGDKVAVVGEAQTRKYTDKKGIERTVTEVVASSVEFVGVKRKELGEFVDINDSDLPF